MSGQQQRPPYPPTAPYPQPGVPQPPRPAGVPPYPAGVKMPAGVKAPPRPMGSPMPAGVKMPPRPAGVPPMGMPPPGMAGAPYPPVQEAPVPVPVPSDVEEKEWEENEISEELEIDENGFIDDLEMDEEEEGETAGNDAEEENPYAKNMASELGLPPAFVGTKVLMFLFFLLFVLGGVSGYFGNMLQGRSSAEMPGVVHNMEIPKGRPRCGLAQKGQGCVLYMMNAKRNEVEGRDFFAMASEILGIPKFQIETANIRYSTMRIPPGYIALLNIPPVQ